MKQENFLMLAIFFFSEFFIFLLNFILSTVFVLNELMIEVAFLLQRVCSIVLFLLMFLEALSFPQFWGQEFTLFVFISFFIRILCSHYARITQLTKSLSLTFSFLISWFQVSLLPLQLFFCDFIVIFNMVFLQFFTLELIFFQIFELFPSQYSQVFHSLYFSVKVTLFLK